MKQYLGSLLSRFSTKLEQNSCQRKTQISPSAVPGNDDAFR